MADPRGTLSIDASALGGVSFPDYVQAYFNELANANTSAAWHGGTEDAAPYGYGANGKQLTYAYKDLGAGSSDPVTHVGIIEGDLSYDAGHYPSGGYPHGYISGSIDSVTFGVIGAGDTAPPGSGAEIYTDYTTELKISGFDLYAAPGTGGSSSSDPVPMLYYAFGRGANEDARVDAFEALLAQYAQNFTGSSGDDTFTSGEFDDRFDGAGGDDTFNGAGGEDTVELAGAASSWTLTDNGDGTWSATKGEDSVTLTDVELAEFDDAIFDFTTGEWTETNFAPEALALDGDSVAENAPDDTLVGTLSADDPEGDDITWTLTGASADLFTIVGNELYANGPFDHEAGATIEVTVVATDAYDNATEKTFTITIDNVNEAPTALLLSNDTVEEALAVGSSVATLSAEDPDSGEFTYSLVNNPGGFFEIQGDQLVVAQGLDFESKDLHTLKIRVTDDQGLSHVERFQIEVTDSRETVKGTSAAETLKGGIGDDNLEGLRGSDKLIGGGGEDYFVFNTKIGTDVDRVADFLASDDQIELSGKIFDALGPQVTAKELAFGLAAADRNDHLIYDQASGKLFYDADGSGKGEAVLFAKFGAGTDLSASDFFIG